MITYYKNGIYEVKNGVSKHLVEIACKSTDTKPTTNIVTGSMALEVDTGKIFAFDEAGVTWIEI